MNLYEIAKIVAHHRSSGILTTELCKYMKLDEKKVIKWLNALSDLGIIYKYPILTNKTRTYNNVLAKFQQFDDIPEVSYDVNWLKSSIVNTVKQSPSSTCTLDQLQRILRLPSTLSAQTLLVSLVRELHFSKKIKKKISISKEDGSKRCYVIRFRREYIDSSTEGIIRLVDVDDETRHDKSYETAKSEIQVFDPSGFKAKKKFHPKATVNLFFPLATQIFKCVEEHHDGITGKNIVNDITGLEYRNVVTFNLNLATLDIRNATKHQRKLACSAAGGQILIHLKGKYFSLKRWCEYDNRSSEPEWGEFHLFKKGYQTLALLEKQFNTKLKGDLGSYGATIAPKHGLEYPFDLKILKKQRLDTSNQEITSLREKTNQQFEIRRLINEELSNNKGIMEFDQLFFSISNFSDSIISREQFESVCQAMINSKHLREFYITVPLGSNEPPASTKVLAYNTMLDDDPVISDFKKDFASSAEQKLQDRTKKYYEELSLYLKKVEPSQNYNKKSVSSDSLVVIEPDDNAEAPSSVHALSFEISDSNNDVLVPTKSGEGNILSNQKINPLDEAQMLLNLETQNIPVNTMLRINRPLSKDPVNKILPTPLKRTPQLPILESVKAQAESRHRQNKLKVHTLQLGRVSTNKKLFGASKSRMRSLPIKEQENRKPNDLFQSFEEEEHFFRVVLIAKSLYGGVLEIVNWNKVIEAIPDLDKKLAKSRWPKISKKFSVGKSLSLIQKEWEKLFLKGYSEGDLPIMKNYDLNLLARYWKKNMRSVTDSAVPWLYENMEENLESFKFTNFDVQSTHDIVLTSSQPQTVERELSNWSAAYSTYPVDEDDPLVESAKCAIKSIIASPASSYSSGRGKQVLVPFGEVLCYEAVSALESDRIVVYIPREKNTVIPERNYKFSDRFQNRIADWKDSNIMHRMTNVYKEIGDTLNLGRGWIVGQHAGMETMICILDLVSNEKADLVRVKSTYSNSDHPEIAVRSPIKFVNYGSTYEFERVRRSTQMSIPIQGPGSFTWTDVLGNPIEPMWRAIVTAILFDIESRPGITIDELVRRNKWGFEKKEIAAVIRWLYKKNVIRRGLGIWALREWYTNVPI